jgi:hypothetical protein
MFFLPMPATRRTSLQESNVPAVLREQLDYLLEHWQYESYDCDATKCMECIRLERVRRLLCARFE